MTLKERQSEFVELFNGLVSWQERFQYLIDLGDELPEMPEHQRSAHTRIECRSQTFFCASVSDGIIYIAGWSNAAIPSGLIALLRQLFDGCHIDEVHHTAIDFHTQTRLIDNMTEQRKSALNEMINRILTL